MERCKEERRVVKAGGERVDFPVAMYFEIFVKNLGNWGRSHRPIR